MRGEAMPAGVNRICQIPPRALCEVERLTRNPEKLDNAGGRCWKDSLGRNKFFSCRIHQPPYPPRRRLITAWQETKKLLQEEIWMDNVRKDLKEKSIGNYQDW